MGKSKPSSRAKKAKDKSSEKNRGSKKAEQRQDKKKFKQQRKRKAEKVECDEFDQQMGCGHVGLGLHAVDIVGDGNCLFRSFADQMTGDQTKHAIFRDEAVEFMRTHKEDFEPFINDDDFFGATEFQQYLEEMAKPSTWGGNLELVALGRRFSCHLVVHQLNAPRLEVRNWTLTATDVRHFHLGYITGDHYCSVRMAGDQGSGEQAKPVFSCKKTASSSSSSSADEPQTKQERIVCQATGCRDLAKVRETLTRCWNDANSAVEMIFAELNDKNGKDDEKAADESGSMERSVVGKANKIKAGEGRDKPPSKENKPKPFLRGNDPCPCGSKKRYKRCCKVSGAAKRLRAAATSKAAEKQVEESKRAAATNFVSGLQGEFEALAI